MTKTNRTTKPAKDITTTWPAPKGHFFRVNLEHGGIPEFNIPASQRGFTVAAKTGPYSATALKAASERAEDNLALPIDPNVSDDAWECRALVIYADLAAKNGGALVTGGNAVLTTGFIQMARECAVAVARRDATTEGDIFIKLLIAQDHDRAVNLPFHGEVAGLLRQMAERDLDALGVDAEDFHLRAAKALKRQIAKAR